SRRVSSISASSSSWKGSGRDSLRILTSVTCTSIAPVASFGFSVPAGREATVPRTASTNSERTASAFACTSPAFEGSNRHWVSPSRSRRSMNTAPPWSRRRKAQPISVTCCPTCSPRSAPQLWVRRHPPNVSVTPSSPPPRPLPPPPPPPPPPPRRGLSPLDHSIRPHHADAPEPPCLQILKLLAE